MKTIGAKVGRMVFVSGVIAGVMAIIPAGAASAGGEEFRAKHSGKCLDVDNASREDGANVKQWSCVGVPQQHWRAIYVGSWYGKLYYRLEVEHSGKCLDVDNASTDDGANVKQWACVAVAQQFWTFEPKGDGYYWLRALHSDKCLDVDNASTDDGANVKQWTCTDVPQQYWKQFWP